MEHGRHLGLALQLVFENAFADHNFLSIIRPKSDWAFERAVAIQTA